MCVAHTCKWAPKLSDLYVTSTLCLHDPSNMPANTLLSSGHLCYSSTSGFSQLSPLLFLHTLRNVYFCSKFSFRSSIYRRPDPGNLRLFEFLSHTVSTLKKGLEKRRENTTDLQKLTFSTFSHGIKYLQIILSLIFIQHWWPLSSPQYHNWEHYLITANLIICLHQNLQITSLLSSKTNELLAISRCFNGIFLSTFVFFSL